MQNLKRLWFFALVLAIFGELSLSATKENADDAAPPGPRLSETGVKRLKDNIKTLEQNIVDAQGNINNCDANSKMVLKELENLDSLQKEQGEVKNMLDKYVADAEQKKVKNEKERLKTLRFEKEVDNSKNVLPESKLKARQQIDRDKTEIERWKTDTAQKLNRISEILFEMKESQSQIDGKRVKLRDEARNWVERKLEYESLLKHYTERKANYDKLLKDSTEATQKRTKKAGG